MRSDYPHIIGCYVQGKIDRPLGSHHPQYSKMIYPINYGYVEGVYAEDGQQQDIYLLGTSVPLSEFKGKVIAVYRRDDDVEDKWVVSINDKNYSDEEILRQISFQEQFFNGKLLR